VVEGLSAADAVGGGGDTGRLRPVRRRRRRARAALLALAAAVVAVGAILFVRGCGGGEAGTNAYRGLGAWVDVFDYVPAVGGPGAPVGPPDVDAMAAQGVRTLYLQAAFDAAALPGGLVPPDLVVPLLRRAHQRGLRVVGWYAPPLLRPDDDLTRLLAIARFDSGGERFDGVAVDIEDRQVASVDARNARVVDLSRRLRETLGARATIGAIVLSPVLMEQVNPNFWPGFPWAAIRPMYDVWLPMAYWTDRLAASGFAEPRRYVTQTVDRTRELLGDPNALMHPIGGVGDRVTEAQLREFAATLPEVRAIGGSIYDYRTMPTGGWGVLRGRVAP
jgi:hypothetical protein